MFRLINFLLGLAVLAAVVVSAYWVVTTPLPPKMHDQVKFGMDTAIFTVQRLKQGGNENVKTWRDLARADNSAAQLHQARMLFNQAKSEPAAYQEAIAILDRLSRKGIPEGQNAYGVMLRDGLGGLNADKSEAYKWFSLAASRGSKLAENNMMELSHRMTSAEIFEAEHRASAWLLDHLNGPAATQ